MLTKSKLSLSGLTFASAALLSACASQAPKVSNAALGYAVTNYAISADVNEQALSAAMGSALNGVGVLTAMPAKAEVTIDLVRYNSPIIGFFYGGQHHATLSVVLTDNSGTRITSFPLYIAANGDRLSADTDLAQKAAEVIAAKAANAFVPFKALPKMTPKPIAAPLVATPIVKNIEPATDDAAPCVIGADGKCVVL